MLDYFTVSDGHRAAFLCPRLEAATFGHACHVDTAITGRTFCGGCYDVGAKSSSITSLLDNYLAFPPPGVVPFELAGANVPRWTFASTAIDASSVRVRVDGNLVAVQTTYGGGCTGYTWLSIAHNLPSSVLVPGASHTIDVTDGAGHSYSYSFTIADCSRVLAPGATPLPTPPPPVVATCGNGIIEGGEDCDGGDCCTPGCAYKRSTAVCRPAIAGGCDVEERCTGYTAACPADRYESSTTTCREVRHLS